VVPSPVAQSEPSRKGGSDAARNESGLAAALPTLHKARRGEKFRGSGPAKFISGSRPSNSKEWKKGKAGGEFFRLSLPEDHMESRVGRGPQSL